jgi:hypothetical protein
MALPYVFTTEALSTRWVLFDLCACFGIIRTKCEQALFFLLTGGIKRHFEP